ncbi:MAG: protein kinase [Desulfosporosinus sp.]|nr:protein kinase [Desulfosporosinus sp.]
MELYDSSQHLYNSVGPLLPLENFFAEIHDAKAIQGMRPELQSHFPLFRHTRWDGNSYYRAVIFSYLERLVLKGEAKTFLRLLQDPHYAVPNDDQEITKILEAKLKVIINTQYYHGIFAGLQKLYDCFNQDAEFDRTAVQWLRCVTATFMRRNRGLIVGGISFEAFAKALNMAFDEYIYEQVMKMGTNPGMMVLAVVPLLLQIGVDVLTLDPIANSQPKNGVFVTNYTAKHKDIIPIDSSLDQSEESLTVMLMPTHCQIVYQTQDLAKYEAIGKFFEKECLMCRELTTDCDSGVCEGRLVHKRCYTKKISSDTSGYVLLTERESKNWRRRCPVTGKVLRNWDMEEWFLTRKEYLESLGKVKEREMLEEKKSSEEKKEVAAMPQQKEAEGKGTTADLLAGEKVSVVPPVLAIDLPKVNEKPSVKVKPAVGLEETKGLCDDAYLKWDAYPKEGTKVREFTLLKRLGKRGGMYKARCGMHSYAIKVIPLKDRSDASIKAKIAIINSMRGINHELYVELVRGMTDEQQRYACIMYNWYSCNDLEQFLSEQHKTLSEDDVACIIQKILQSYTCLREEKGLIHENLTSGNILLRRDAKTNKYEAMMCDYISARLLQEPAERIEGAPEYASPQVVKGLEHTYKTDIWSIGVLAYHMLTGKFPFNTVEELECGKYTIIGGFSYACMDFITGCIQLKECDRMNIDQLKVHPWLKRCSKLELSVKDGTATDVAEGLELSAANRKSYMPIDGHYKGIICEKDRINDISQLRAEDPVTIGEYNLIFIGDKSVGKFTLLNRCTEHITVEFKSMENVLYFPYQGAKLKFHFINISDKKCLKSEMITDIQAQRPNVIILMFSVDNKRSFDNIKEWFVLANDNIRYLALTMLVANKIDLRSEITSEEAEAIADRDGMLYVETSARTDQGVATMLAMIARKLLEIRNATMNVPQKLQ